MSPTLKVVTAALVGAVAAFMIDGDFSVRSFVRLIGNLALSGAMAVVVMFFVHSFGESPEFVQWALAGLVGGLTMHITRRMKSADVSIKLGSVVELTSEGIPYDSK
jgi:hypothetical protein